MPACAALTCCLLLTSLLFMPLAGCPPAVLPPCLPACLPQVVLGLPIVPSLGNLDFWLRLCGVRGMPEAQALLRSFPAGDDAGDKAAHAAAVKAWNADLIARSLSLPGVAGLHVMPLTKSARQLTLDFLADGTLPSGLTTAE